MLPQFSKRRLDHWTLTCKTMRHTTHRNQLEMDPTPRHKNENHETLRKHGVNLHELGKHRDLLATTPKAQATKEKSRYAGMEQN